MTTDTTAPTTLRAGDSASWTETLPSFPATDGWALHYRIVWRASGVPPVDIATTASVDSYTAALTSAATAAYPVGPATLVRWVTRADDRITLSMHALDITPDLTSAASVDNRSGNQKALDDARAALASHIASGQAKVASYTINNRAMQFRSLADLTQLVQHYEREVAKENALTAALNGIAAGRVITRM